MANQHDPAASIFFRIVGGIFGTVGGLSFYGAYNDSWKAQFIRNTPYVKLSDIPHHVTSNAPVYLKTYGNVGAEDPITAEFTGKKAAIYQKRTYGLWYTLVRDTPNNHFHISKHTISTPYYIQNNPDTTKLYVRNFPVNLELVESREEDGGHFLLSLFLGYFRVPYPYKIVHEEKILPTNKRLLILGNVTKSVDGDYYISQAKEGFLFPKNPSLATLKTEEDVIDHYEESSRTKLWLGAIVSGLSVLSFFASTKV